MIKKTAGIGSVIQQRFPDLRPIYTGPGLTDDDVFVPPVSGMSPNTKVNFIQSAPPDASGAVAYVSSKDKNNNGVVDTVTIIIPNLERHGIFPHVKGEMENKLRTMDLKNLPKDDPELREIYANILVDLGELLSHEIEGHIGPSGAKGGEFHDESVARSKESAYRSRARLPSKKQASQNNDLLVKKEIAKLTDALADLEEYSLAKSAYKISSEIKKISSEENSGKKLSGEDLKNLTTLLEKQFLR